MFSPWLTPVEVEAVIEMADARVVMASTGVAAPDVIAELVTGRRLAYV